MRPTLPLAPLILAIACAATPPAQDGGRAQNAGRPYSYAEAQGVRRFEVRSGDHWPSDGSQPKERSETYFTQKFATGRTYRVAFRFLIEPGPRNTASWLTLAQIQSTFAPGSAGHSPPIAIELKGERFRVMSRTSPKPDATQADVAATMLFNDGADLSRGSWHDVAVTFRFDPAGNGLVRVVLDGRQVVDHRGPVGFDERVGAYVKQGIYRAAAPEPIAARFTSPVVTAPPGGAADR